MTIYTFAEGHACSFCGNSERTILISEAHPEGLRPEGLRPEAGACEACSVELYWTWKKLLADAAPRDTAKLDSVKGPRVSDPRVSDPRVNRVKVLIARRVSLRSGELAPEKLSTSYEMLVAPLPDGTIDLPTEDVREGEAESEAASRALAKIGVITWPIFLDVLYTAHSPRGSLCRVYLARAWAKAPSSVDGPPLPWRRWPLGEHAPAMAGFYLALKDIWPLILRSPRTPATSEICVYMRQGAAEYVRLQQQVRSGNSEVDTSMSEYLRKGMTDDEKLVDVALKTRAGLDAEASVLVGEGNSIGNDTTSPIVIGTGSNPADQYLSQTALNPNVVDAEEILDAGGEASDEQLFGEDDDQ